MLKDVTLTDSHNDIDHGYYRLLQCLKRHYIARGIPFPRKSRTHSMTCGAIQRMISRGMVNSISIPQKKVGAGRVVVKRRTPDLRLESTSSYQYLPKIYDAVGKLEESKMAAYCGFDPTASCLHIGHMTVLSPLFHFLRNGQRVITLVGGATGRLGDPSGKTKDRPRLGTDVMRENARQLQGLLTTMFTNYCRRHGLDGSLFSVLNNEDWYKEMSVAEYAREMAPHFKLTEMFSRSLVKDRLSKESKARDMKLREFLYQTFQCHDWYHLFVNHSCAVQVGGHDQLGNIEDGYGYIWNRTNLKPDLAGITVPLMVTRDGQKLGKSSGNAVWLNSSADNLSRYFKTFDDDQLRGLALQFTVADKDNIAALHGPALVDMLVDELTALVS